jgi:hypothetical protein
MAKGCSGKNKIGEAIDRKFAIDALCLEHNDTVDENHAVVFLAKDKALPGALRAYEQECIALGADDRQITAVRGLLARVEAYQREHADMVKVPDVDQGPAGDHVVGVS